MKILFISLGCDKNLADSEEMLGLLTGSGHEIVDSEEEAEAIVINTCCFIHDAKEESVNTILEMAEYKKTGKCKALVVTGCMAQRYKEEITQETLLAAIRKLYAERQTFIDAMSGSSHMNSIEKITGLIEDCVNHK